MRDSRFQILGFSDFIVAERTVELLAAGRVDGQINNVEPRLSCCRIAAAGLAAARELGGGQRGVSTRRDLRTRSGPAVASSGSGSPEYRSRTPPHGSPREEPRRKPGRGCDSAVALDPTHPEPLRSRLTKLTGGAITLLGVVAGRRRSKRQSRAEQRLSLCGVDEIPGTTGGLRSPRRTFDQAQPLKTLKAAVRGRLRGSARSGDQLGFGRRPLS